MVEVDSSAGRLTCVLVARLPELYPAAARLLRSTWADEFAEFDGCETDDDVEALLKRPGTDTFAVVETISTDSHGVMTLRVVGAATIASDDWGVGARLGSLVAADDPIGAGGRWLGNVVVVPELRGRGIGRTLVTRVLEWWTTENPHPRRRQLWLWTQTRERARWWEGSGFRLHSEITEHGSLRHLLVMMYSPASRLPGAAAGV